MLGLGLDITKRRILESGVVPPLYDAHPALWGISSGRQLKTAVVDIERDREDNLDAEQDFTALEKTDGTLITFTGVNNGFTVKPYDQSGNALVTQNIVKAEQPQSVVSGALVTSGGLPAWDNLNNAIIGFWRSTTNLVISGATEMWLFMVLDITDVTTTQFLNNSRSVSSAPAGTYQVAISASELSLNFWTAVGVANPNKYPISTGRQQITIKIDSNVTGTNWSDVWINGSPITANSTTAITPTTFNDERLHLFIPGWQTTLAYLGKSQESHAYLGDQSSNRTAIESNLKAFWGTP